MTINHQLFSSQKYNSDVLQKPRVFPYDLAYTQRADPFIQQKQRSISHYRQPEYPKIPRAPHTNNRIVHSITTCIQSPLTRIYPPAAT